MNFTLYFELPEPLQAVVFFVVGLIVGSFLNVVVCRLPRNLSLLRPSSRCGTCRSPIPAWMNIPLLSFFYTSGSCVRCGYFYSGRYPMIEFLTGVVFVAVWSVYGWSASAIFFSGFSALLLAMSFIDLEFRIIPDSMSLGAWGVAWILALLGVQFFPIPLNESLFGAVVGFGLFWMLSRGYYWFSGEEGLGGGDVKLMGLVGAVLGLHGVITTILVGSVLGALVGGVLVFGMRKGRRFPIPFGPFLAMGALVSVFRLDGQLWVF